MACSENHIFGEGRGVGAVVTTYIHTVCLFFLFFLFSFRSSSSSTASFICTVLSSLSLCLSLRLSLSLSVSVSLFRSEACYIKVQIWDIKEVLL